MKLRGLAVVGSVVAFAPTAAFAGGLFLPGNGAISTSRAGAAVASTEDGEALSVNPAGLAKTRGTTITVSAAIISYAMQFTRRGTYDPLEAQDRPYEGQPYATIENNPDLPLGIGSYQPVPVVAIASDLGGAVPGLRLAAGLYAPNAYPFRDMTGGYEINADFDAPPPPTRYDIMEQEAAMLFPSLGASYRVLPNLDVGLRLSMGFAHLKSTVAVWGLGANYEEDVRRDAVVTVDAKDNFVPTFGLGAMYRPHPNVELGFNFNFSSSIHAKGGARAEKGPDVQVAMQAAEIGPATGAGVRCATGGTFEEQKACIDLQLPMNAQLGARYKFLDANGELRGDLELDVGWEHWGKRCDGVVDFADGCISPGQYRVIIDAAAYLDTNGNGDFTDEEEGVSLKESILDHRFSNTYSLRLGGSYHIPLAASRVILRGGVGYDTRAADEGWLRADIDGAGRTTATVGASYRAAKFEISIGGGVILEGTQRNDGECNPTPTADNTQPGCGPNGERQPVDEREGPDPVDPLVVPASQLQSPIAQGTFESHYTLLMLGFSTWF